jgi:hypothetical protein
MILISAPEAELECERTAGYNVRFTLKTMMLYVACAAGILAYVRYLADYIPFWLLTIPCFILLAGHGL